MALNRWAFDAKHIPGSIHFDTPDELYRSVRPDDEVVVYCSHVDCLSSVALYRDLVRRGYPHVRRYAGVGCSTGRTPGSRWKVPGSIPIVSPRRATRVASVSGLAFDTEIAAEIEGWYELLGLVRSLTPAERAEPGDDDAPVWSVRDVVAHLVWLAEAEIQLERIGAGEADQGHELDIDALNADFLAKLGDQPRGIAWLQANAGRTRMLQAWNELAVRNDEAAWWVRKSGCDHYAEHNGRLREWSAELISRRRPPS